jgi:16S rRNA (cytosine967-C5)-methyltransferase
MHPKLLLQACSDLVRLTLTFEHPADSVVSKFFRDNRKNYALGQRERALLAETVYNVLRYKLRYDHFAPSGSGPKERRLAILGFAQHLMDHSPTGAPLPGATPPPKRQEGASSRNRFVPKVHATSPIEFLKSALTEQEVVWVEACLKINVEDLLERHRHNLPEWMVDPLKAQVGDGFWPLVESLNKSAALDLRVNDWLAKREDVQAQLKELGIKSVLTPMSPWGLRISGKPPLADLAPFKSGLIEVQDEGSQMLALLLDAKRGEMVVDFCAGAGGKTLAIGASMRNTGRLYAFDTSAHRLDALKPRLAKSQLSNVHPAVIAHERDERVKRLSGKIDRVLVDSPCSGLGTIRRNPDLKWRQSPTSVAELGVKQRSILQSAAKLLKVGGRLVYATCSFLVEENEQVAKEFSLAHPGFRPLSVSELLTQLKVSHPETLCTADGMYLRLWPHLHQCDGFFAAAWVRES